jgi:hypothetical protein
MKLGNVYIHMQDLLLNSLHGEDRLKYNVIVFTFLILDFFPRLRRREVDGVILFYKKMK